MFPIQSSQACILKLKYRKKKKKGITGINKSLLLKSIPYCICAIEKYLSKLLQTTWYPTSHSRQAALFMGNE